MSAIVNQLTQRLAKLETAIVSDVLDEAGLPNQILVRDLRPIDPELRLAGEAFCVRGENRITTRTPAPQRFSAFEIDKRITEGKVAVVDCGGHEIGAVIGGFMAISLKRHGCRGLVINGAVRDTLEIKALQLPTFARFQTPANASRRWDFVEFDTTLALPGLTGPAVIVHPGDFVLGDADGLIVIPKQFAEPVINAAEELSRIEKQITAELNSGVEREEAFARHPRFQHIKRLQP